MARPALLPFVEGTNGSATDGLSARKRVESGESFDLALLDIMLPGVNGFALMDTFQQNGIPVIFLTAKNAVEDKVHGLKNGAEDYIVKPFELPELLVRIEKVLERHAPARKTLSVGDVELELESRTAQKNGEPLDLTPTLRYLDMQSRTRQVRNVTKEAQVRGLMPSECTMQMTPYDAAETARTFLQRAGIDCFSVEQIALYNSRESTEQWYRVSCKRVLNGVKVTSTRSEREYRWYKLSSSVRKTIDGLSTESSGAWLGEQLVFLITDAGIQRIFWGNPIAAINVSETVPRLAPFSDILAVAESVLIDQWRETSVSRTVTVEHIALTVMPSNDPETPDKGFLIPVWCIRYSVLNDIEPWTIVLHAETGEVLFPSAAYQYDSADATYLTDTPWFLSE